MDFPAGTLTDASFMPAPFQGLRRGYYGVLLVDPPWRFKNYSAKGMSRSAENHYPTMTVEEICTLPVGLLAAKDCVLFLWITDPFRERVCEVFKAWGFKYSTRGFVWIKPKADSLTDVPDITAEELWEQGTGYTTRANPEDCLLARRGRLQRKARDVSRVIVAPKREHSRKPEEIYRRIERLVSGPYCELFARHRREGWDSWGAGLETVR